MDTSILRKVVENRKTSYGIGRQITTAQLNIPNADRLDALFEATIVSEADLAVADVLILPYGPIDQDGVLQVTPAEMLGEKPVKVTFVEILDAQTNQSKARQGEYALSVVGHSDTDIDTIFGPVGTQLIAKAADLATMVCMQQELAALMTSALPVVPGNNNNDPAKLAEHFASTKVRQELKLVDAMRPFLSPATVASLFPGVDDNARRNAATVSVTSGVARFKLLVAASFNHGLEIIIDLSDDQLRSILLGLPVSLSAFAKPSDKKAVPSVDAVRALAHMMARVMALVYKADIIALFYAMTSAFCDHLSAPADDGSSVATAIEKTFVLVSTYSSGIAPELTPIAAMTKAWTIEAEGPTVMRWNRDILQKSVQAANDFARSLQHMQVATRSRGGGDSDKADSGGRRGNGPNLSGAKRTAETSPMPFPGWLAKKPIAAKKMVPPLCAFVGTCGKEGCTFEHDLDKVPSEARPAVDRWLAQRPATFGVRPESKKPKVTK